MTSRYHLNEIIKLAIPNIISNITVPLLSIADTMIAGHLPKSESLAGIAVATTLVNTIYWLWGFLRMATTGLTAQAYGRKDNTYIKKYMTTGVVISIVVGMLLYSLKSIFCKLTFIISSGDATLSKEAIEYISIIFLGAPAVLLSYTFNGWFIGMQDTKIPMVIAITTNILNIIFSVLFSLYMGMGIKGLALGTIASQYIGIILFAYFLKRNYYNLLSYHNAKEYNSIQNPDSVIHDISDKASTISFSGTSTFGKNITRLTASIYRLLRFKMHHNINSISNNRFFDIYTLKKYFVMGKDLMLRTIMMSSIYLFFAKTGSSYGADTVSANAIVMLMFTIFSYFMDGFAYAAEALTGKYIGMRKETELYSMVKSIFSIGFMVALLVSVIYFFFSKEILSMISDKDSIVFEALKYDTYIYMIPLASFVAFLMDGMFVGATESQQLRNTMLISFVMFFVTYYICVAYMGAASLWLSFVVYLLSRSIYQILVCKKVLIKSLSISNK